MAPNQLGSSSFHRFLPWIGEDQVISNSVRAKQQPYCSREFRDSLAQVGWVGHGGTPIAGGFMEKSQSKMDDEQGDLLFQETT